MKLGIDQLNSIKKKLRGKRIGLLAHAASVNSQGFHLISQLQSLETSLHFQIVKLFGPEHGIWGVAQDMEEVSSSIEPLSGLKTQSLYGKTFESLSPSLNDLKNIDLIICDLQDVGSRYYTFIYTLAFTLKVCGPLKIPVIVLDRPNPINGKLVEGGRIEAGFESFVGAFSIANRHGMSIGEMSHFLNEEHQFKASLEVVPLQLWNRGQEWEFPVLPSPNMPTLSTALVYPGMCLVEATEISEGRGTTKPFEIFGAPYIHPEKFCKAFENLKLPGLKLRPLYFKPTFQKLAGQVCGGAQIHLTDLKRFKPYLTGLAILKILHDLYPKHFKWRKKAYEFVEKIPAIDLLTGSSLFRQQLEKGLTFKEIKDSYEIGKEEFLKKRKNYLLY